MIGALRRRDEDTDVHRGDATWRHTDGGPTQAEERSYKTNSASMWTLDL